MGRVQWNNLAPLIQSKLVLLRPRIPGCTTESSNLVEVFIIIIIIIIIITIIIITIIIIIIIIIGLQSPIEKRAPFPVQ